MSIKFKITLWYTSFMVILVYLVLFFLTAVSGTFYQENMSVRLESFTTQNAREVEYKVSYNSHTTYINVIFDVEDFVERRSDMTCFVFRSNGDLLLGPNDEYFEDVEFENDSIRVKTVDGQKYIIYDIKDVTDPKKPGDYVWVRGVCKVDVELYSGTVGTVIDSATKVLPLVVVFASVTGYIMATFMLRPIKKISQAAESISDGEDLSQRINIKKGNDEVHKLANTVDKMIGRLERSFEAEKAFASDASHELRTPTGVILAQCEYSLEEEQSKEEYKEALTLIQRQARKMSQLISQLLAFTRMEMHTEKINKEHIDLNELLQGTCEDMEIVAQKNISLECECGADLSMEGDHILICRIITNIISNAYKYGKENGHIWVRAYGDDKYVYIRVKDDGIGIAQEDLTKIFGRFYRADKSRAIEKGYGLGLSLALQAAECHGGTIQVTSEIGEGSEFVVKMLKKS